MLTTCPHCGTRSPASAFACAGCDRALYPLTAPPPPPPFKFRTRTNYVRLSITLGVVALLVGAGTSSGMLMNRDDNRNDQADDKQVSQYKMVDTGASPDPSPTSASPSPKVKKKKASKSPTPSPSKPSTSAPPKPEPTKKPKPTNPLPYGFHRVVDDRGFSLAVIKGWERRELSPTQIGYLPPSGNGYLHVSQVANAPRASFINFLELEQSMAESDNGYERIALEHRTYKGHPAARWEFTYVPESGEKMRVREQAYIDDDGTEYTIYVESADRLWDAEKDLVFSTALNTFKRP